MYAPVTAPDLPTRWESSGPPQPVFVDGAWIDVPGYRRSHTGTVATIAAPIRYRCAGYEFRPDGLMIAA